MNALALTLGHSCSGTTITWSNPENPHAAIFGRSGSGKSYFLHGLLEQAVQEGAICIVLDYSNDFRGYLPPANIPVYCTDVSNPTFTINPLAGSTPQNRETCVQNLSGLLGSTFRMGNRARLSLRSAALKYLEEVKSLPTLDGLIEFVQIQGLWGAFYTPLKLLSSLLHSGSVPISLELSSPGLTVLTFNQIVDKQMRSLTVELILYGIWCQRTTKHECDHPLIILLDEAQHLNWHDSGMPVCILREGRKYGVGGWFSTQWFDNRNPDALHALGQAALQVNFRPDDHNILPLAKVLGRGEKSQTIRYQRALSSLQRGQFLLQRPDGKTILVNVPPREKTDTPFSQQ